MTRTRGRRADPGPYASLGDIGDDLDRLDELTGPHVHPGDDDLAQAVARIPAELARREAGRLLDRLRPAIGPHLDAINAACGG